MAIKENFKKLNVVGEVTSCKWRTVMSLVDSINNDKKTIVLEKEWGNDYRKDSFLDLSKRETWSTYDDTCIDLNFSLDNKKLICEARIYDGESFCGSRRGLRFITKIQLQNNFIEKIDGLLEYEFKHFLNNEYEKHLELLRMEWVKKEREIIMNG